MPVSTDRPWLALGLGCRHSCPAEVLLALITQSLHDHGLGIGAVSALASIDSKCDEPGLWQAAEQLGLPLVFFSAAQLQAYEGQLTHHSALAFERTGCRGVAESTALALASQLSGKPAWLRITYRKNDQATLALASSPVTGR
ncbi:cobalamin biosynthesis protein CobE [Pseudomonas sp. Leaf127]|uniref:cobalamin biosynthesis protein n=1 Tax=Pseudomonas sp. Leaf127 TaxID=1736267 RepID=UPI00070396F8|nr:cobalamin biosynthesis protein [Pseudomonas sp. Leaf127]KQQ55779.1 cobalamin biosynthesis protein CobE [Pseudomonas sp. Leaf127]